MRLIDTINIVRHKCNMPSGKCLGLPNRRVYFRGVIVFLIVYVLKHNNIRLFFDTKSIADE